MRPQNTTRAAIGDDAGQQRPVSRRARQKQDKLRRIMRAARELFSEKGFEATTIQAVAERADIGTGTLFLYAKSKEDLLLLAFIDDVPLVLARALATLPPDASLVDQLLHVIDAVVEHQSKDVTLSRYHLREISFVRNPEMLADSRRLMVQMNEALAGIIRHAQDRGAIKGTANAWTVAESVFALYFAPLTLWLNGYIDLDRYRRKLRTSLELYIDGLAVLAAERCPCCYKRDR